MAKKRSGDNQPVSDVYVGLLAISLLAQIVGIVFLVLDYQAMKASPLPKLEKFTWSPVAAPAPGGQGMPAGPGDGGAVPPGGAIPPGGAAPGGAVPPGGAAPGAVPPPGGN